MLHLSADALISPLIQQYCRSTSGEAYRNRGFVENVSGSLICFCAIALWVSLKVRESGEKAATKGAPGAAGAVVNAQTLRAESK